MENQSPISRVAGETLTYTLAELHVHGLLAGIATVCSHRVSHDAIAITITTIGAAVVVRSYFVAHRKMRTANPVKFQVWYTKNF